MNNCYLIFNPHAAKGNGLKSAEKAEAFFPDMNFIYLDITGITDPVGFLHGLSPEDKVVFAGGDGTLNIVANTLYGKTLPVEVYYFPAGSGNDFRNDLPEEEKNGPVLLSKYIAHLPKVTLDTGEEQYFLNAIGYGLDGYCCEENDRLRALGKKRAYTVIAFLGVMGKFKPCGGTITVDGVSNYYDKIWMAPVANGRFFGGGVKIAPDQVRNNPEHTVTSVAVHSVGRIKALLLFLSVVKGNGGKYPRYIAYNKGHDITVAFDSPRSLQIDGETRLNVRKCRVQYD